jgi:type I restriction enzyme S subunit
LENYLVASPGEKLMSKYDDIAGAFQSQMQLCQLENLALKEIRDSLLPRLISGELEIPKNAWAF